MRAAHFCISASVAAERLVGGLVVAIPTETVYGLAAHALDEAAVRRIFAIKGRPLIDPLIVHVSGRADAESLATVSATAGRLMAAFWPGPLTLVLEKRAAVPDLVTAGRSTVALRSPAHPVAREILRLAGIPLAAPSANPFGYLSPTCAAHVAATLGGAIDGIVDGGPCPIGIESTVVMASGTGDAAIRILREGAITAEQLEIAGVRIERGGSGSARADGAGGAGMAGPGMLAAHYQPRTPLVVRDSAEAAARAATESGDAGKPSAVVLFARPQGHSGRAGTEHLFWLSEDGDPAEAARQLYGLLHELDGGKFGQIVVQAAPEAGIGAAINDRLRRAAAK